jgi:hypothetical protein
METAGTWQRSNSGNGSARAGTGSSSRWKITLSAAFRVRATASYFRVGHLLLDSLTRSLQFERQIQALDLPAGQLPDQARAPSVPIRC